MAWQAASGFPDGAQVRGIDWVDGRWYASGSVGSVPAIWTSGDGVGWTAAIVTSEIGADESGLVQGVAAIGPLLVAAGSYGLNGTDQIVPTTWTSEDGGSTWTEDRGDVRPWSFVEEIPGGLIGSAGNLAGTIPYDSWIVLSADGRDLAAR